MSVAPGSGVASAAFDEPLTHSAERSVLHCTGDGNMLRRSCIVENACHNAADNRWYLYSGIPDPQGRPDCVDGVCNDNPWLYLLPLPYDVGLLKPRVVAGAPPPDRSAPPPNATAAPTANATAADAAPAPAPVPVPVHPPAHWYGEDRPGFLQSRHYPENFFHSICDDFYGLYWGLRRALQHPAYAPSCPDAYGGSGAVQPAVAAAGGDGIEVINVIQDGWPFDLPSQRLVKRFHHVQYKRPADLHADTGAELVCFKRILMGTPGISVHRNAAYSYHPARSWPDPINKATQREDERAFAQFFTARTLVEAGGTLSNYTAPTRDTIVLLQRPHTRHINNMDELVGIVGSLRGNFSVVSVQFEGMPDGEVMALMQRTVMLIAAHGAGLTNMWYMQPSSAVVEIVPPGQPETQNFFGALAYSLGLRHRTMNGLSNGGFNEPLTVHAAAFRGFVDILLQDYDDRRPTRRLLAAG